LRQTGSEGGRGSAGGFQRRSWGICFLDTRRGRVLSRTARNAQQPARHHQNPKLFEWQASLHKFNQRQSSRNYSVMEPLIFADDEPVRILDEHRETQRKCPNFTAGSPGPANWQAQLFLSLCLVWWLRNNAFTFDLRKPWFSTIDSDVYDSQFGISRMNKLQPSRVS